VKIRREIVVVDVSGRHVADDPQFQALFEELKDPTLSGVLVSEQSRLVRPETFDDYRILGIFQKHQCSHQTNLDHRKAPFRERILVRINREAFVFGLPIYTSPLTAWKKTITLNGRLNAPR